MEAKEEAAIEALKAAQDRDASMLFTGGKDSMILLWLCRERLSPDRYETLTYAAFGAAVLAISVGLGLVLAFEVPYSPYGPGFLAGVAVGTAVVSVVERAVLPERLRGTGL